MFYTKQLNKQNIIEIYTTIAPLHFSTEELRPLANLQSLIDRNGYEGLGLYDTESNALAGYGFFVRNPDADIALLDYYAILEEYRSQGVGSFFLTQMKKHYRNLRGILLETEDYDTASTEEERSVRARRDAFYMRNEALRTSTKTTVFGVDFQIFFIPTIWQATNTEANNNNGYFSCLGDNDSGTHTPAIKAELTATENKILHNYIETLYRFMLTDEAYNKNVRWRS